jgi:exodeoxyribonuclease V alpha subunit
MKPIPGSSEFYYHSKNPLPADVVVVDEASMVDLALMAKLVRSLSAGTRLILLGDKDQLASVEAGAVLGDICAGAGSLRFSPEMIRSLEAVSADRLSDCIGNGQGDGVVQDCIVPLSKSYRFASGSRIDALRLAVNAGRAGDVHRLLDDAGDATVNWQSVDSAPRLFKRLSERLSRGYGSSPAGNDPARALESLDRERLLCVVREGPWGVRTINHWMEARSYPQRRDGLESRWYPGRPVLITANDYRLGLFNGDVGITLSEPGDADGRLDVFFPAHTGEIRKIPVHRIADHETAWAMTVHKSQGSEFDHVHLILPDSDIPLLTRELIYTAVTRAKSSVTIYGRRRILTAAIGRTTQRSSGLREALWGAS